MRVVTSAGMGQFRFPANSTPSLSFPVGLDATKTFFVDNSGNPCFGLGEDAFDLAVVLTASQIEQYLSDRSAKGINLIWWAPIDPITQTTPPNNANGDAPFSGANFTNFNTAYWNFVDYVMQRCLVYGITVAFNPAFMGLNDSSGYHSSFYGSSDAVLQGYASFLGARYGGFKNLIWLHGGDSDPNNATMYAKINTFAVALKSADTGNHLATHEASRFLDGPGSAAPNGGYSSVDAHTIAYGSAQSWLDVNWVYQTEATAGSGSQRCYSQGKPCLFGEGWYELEHSTAPLDLRGQGYGSILGGSTLGHLFGNGQIWPFSAPNSGNGTTPNWTTQLFSTGSLDFQRLGKLFRSRRHQLLVPDTGNTTMTVGSSGGSFCARESQTIIAYLPSSQTITIDMTKITDAGSLTNCNWYNPRNGVVTAIGNIANTGTHNFTSPDANDWVLVIDSAAANFRTPGT